MDITNYKIENDSLIQVNNNTSNKDWIKTIDWIDIRSDNRTEVADYLQKLDFLIEETACLEHPEAYPFSNVFEDATILNLSISGATNIYKTDYITVILRDKIIITVRPQNTDLFNKRNLSGYSENEFPSLSNFLSYILAVKTVAEGNINMIFTRKRIENMEYIISNEPENLSSKDLMACEKDLSQLSDIIEDQHVGFEILSSQDTNKYLNDDAQLAAKAIKGFKPLNNAMLRLEKKAEALRLHYMLMVQEKSTRKINVLTIIQAIFVPLTFIAGVYGMNFTKMPELEWPLGYLIVWIVFIGLASGLLSYFYRKGWFN